MTTTQATEREQDKKDVSHFGTALDLTYASHQAQNAMESSSWLSRMTRTVGRSLTTVLGWGGGGQEEELGQQGQQGAGEGDENGDKDQDQVAVPERVSLLSSSAAAAATEVDDHAADVAFRSAMDNISRFLAIILWKCFCAEARSSSHGLSSSLSSSIGNSVKSTLAFSGTNVTSRLWAHILTHHQKEVRHLDRGGVISMTSRDGFIATFLVFAAGYQHQLLVLSDDEIHKGTPLPLAQVVHLVKLLKSLCFNGCVALVTRMQEEEDERLQAARLKDGTARSSTQQQQQQEEELTAPAEKEVPFEHFAFTTFHRLLRNLFDRWSRRAFATAELWLMDETSSRRIKRAVQAQDALGKLLIQVMPYAIPFSQRLHLFRSWIKAEKRFYQNPERRPIIVKIRRRAVLEDGLSFLNNLQMASIKGRVIIVYIAEDGHQEAGIDTGGLFKDFMNDLCHLVLQEDFGLFTRTSTGYLYPNPSSGFVHNSRDSQYDHLLLFEFVGRILSKAIFEGIVISPIFTSFFLGYMKGNYNYMNALDDLSELDPELAKNLNFLRHCQDNIEELGLCFVVNHDDFGRQEEVALLPNGRNVAVTNANKYHYIHLVAKHYLVDRLAAQTQAFIRGFSSVIPPYMLTMFNEPELQILISGSIREGIDLEDLKRNCQYGNGYRSADKHVRQLWKILQDFDQAQLASFLHFVTSCSRAPSGGFRELQPTFTIVRVSIQSDEERLPVGRTCFNQLLWPTYRNASKAKQKLLYAITSQAGFELT